MERRVLAIALAVIVGLLIVNLGAPVGSHNAASSVPAFHAAIPRSPALQLPTSHAAAPATHAAAPAVHVALAPTHLSRLPSILPATVTIILPNGSLAGHSAPISISANTYT